MSKHYNPNLKPFLLIVQPTILMLILLAAVGWIPSNIHAASPIGNDMRPGLVFSENRVYFAVAVRKGFNDPNGYMAVFKTDTRELQFKVDSIVSYDFVVSNDGNRLIASVYDYEGEKVNWAFQVFTAHGSKRHFLFQTDLKRFEDVGVMLTLPRWMLQDDRIFMTHEGKGYRVSLPDFKLKKVKAAKIQFTEQSYQQQEADFQSIFGVYQLQGKVHL